MNNLNAPLFSPQKCSADRSSYKVLGEKNTRQCLLCHPGSVGATSAPFPGVISRPLPAVACPTGFNNRTKTDQVPAGAAGRGAPRRLLRAPLGPGVLRSESWSILVRPPFLFLHLLLLLSLLSLLLLLLLCLRLPCHCALCANFNFATVASRSVFLSAILMPGSIQRDALLHTGFDVGEEIALHVVPIRGDVGYVKPGWKNHVSESHFCTFGFFSPRPRTSP